MGSCAGIMTIAGGRAAASAGPVAIDQVGYRPGSAKYAFVATEAESIKVIDASSLQVRYSAPLVPWQSNDPATGRTIRRGDFSAFDIPGEYTIVTSTGDRVEGFTIADTVYRTAYRRALKAFYYQRCGSILAPEHAGAFWHPQCHALDALLHSSTDSSGFRSTAGGWHDAGDYGKYVVNAGISVATLMMAYEYFPALFSQDDLNIPESGNGVPDILDEVRYELSWLLTMQRADGGVYFKVTRTQFEGFVMPQQDNGTRYLYQVSSTATADFAAVMARAARVYLPFDSVFASQCGSASLRAWTFLAMWPAIVPAGGFHNPAGTETGEYGDADDMDERLWAAAELFATTGIPAYNTTFILNYSSGGVFSAAMSWRNVRSIKSTQQGIDHAVQADLRQALRAYCQSQVTKRNTSGYHVVLQPGEYYWGSNSGALNAAFLLLLGYHETGDQGFLRTAEDQLHYVLGANAHGLSFVTGVGSRYPLHPHHRPSAADAIPEPVPGLLVGGPEQYRSDPVLQALFTSASPPALCYADSVSSYASNEIAINWNAPLVFVTGYFNGLPPTGVGETQRAGRSSGFLLRQNYPNPFNGITRIPFYLSDGDELQLQVTDIIGRRVATEFLGHMPAGEHVVTWEAYSRSGTALSSGAYIITLMGTHAVSNPRSLILIK